MTIQAGSIGSGAAQSPLMDLVFDAVIARKVDVYFASGSMENVWTLMSAVIPCDVAPLTDALRMTEAGDREIASHIIHFQAGADVHVRDAVKIVGTRARFGPVGEWYYVNEVLFPSESIAYVRCRVVSGTNPVPAP